MYAEDVENILIQKGGTFHIGERGAIEVYYGWCGFDRTYKKHYAHMIGGKVV